MPPDKLERVLSTMFTTIQVIYKQDYQTILYHSLTALSWCKCARIRKKDAVASNFRC